MRIKVESKIQSPKSKIALPWLAAALSGILLTLCFPRWNQTWLCWVALTPLISAIWFSNGGGKRPWLRKAALGYCAGFVFFFTVFNWLETVALFDWFSPEHTILRPLCRQLLPLLLAAYMGLYFAFWGWFVGTLVRDRTFLSSRRNLGIAFACSAAWVTQEWLRGVVFTGFGWNGLGVALHDDLPMIQIADITGVGGLSFLVAFCNLIAVITVRRVAAEIGRVRLRPHYDFSLTMALIVIVFSYGIHELVKKPEPSTDLRVAAVQANIPQNEKFDNAFEQKIFDRYSNLTHSALALNPQLLIWPEAATPRGMFADQTNNHFVLDLAATGDFSFLLGTLDFDEEGDYNIAVLLTDRGRNYQMYRKMHLVPFGEFIPFRNSFPLFAAIAGDLVPGDFKRGTSHVVLEMQNPPVKVAALICFEDSLGDLTRRFVRNGAQLLVNITNDGWFLKSAGAEQHLAHAVFRSVETRRPLVRAANTGVTCFVNRVGKVEQSLRSPKGDSFIEGILFGKVKVPHGGFPTFYVNYGDLFSYVCCGATCALLLGILVRRMLPQP